MIAGLTRCGHRPRFRWELRDAEMATTVELCAGCVLRKLDESPWLEVILIESARNR